MRSRLGRIAVVVFLVAVVIGYGARTASADPLDLYVATSGNDSGNCQDASFPCATISYAASQAVNATTINVGPGTFFVSANNAMGVGLTVQGSSTGPAPATIVEPRTPGNVFDATNGQWTLEDLTIDGEGGDA